MQSSFTNASDFRQERDFGNKIAATFEFLTAHWRPLGRCLVYFVLPAALVMGVGLGLLTNAMSTNFRLVNSRVGSTGLLSSSYLSAGLILVGALLAGLLLLSTVYAYVRLVVLTGAAPTPAPVWQEIKQRIGRMLGAFALLFGLYLGIAAVVISMMAINPMFGLLMFVLFPLILYVVVPLALYFPVLWLEDAGLWQGLRRCFFLVRGKWWSTFGLIFVTGIIQFLLCILFALPQSAVTVGKALDVPGLDSEVLNVLTQCIYALGAMLTYAIPLLAVLFQYFNLVERKEGLGLHTLINSIGQGTTPVAYNQAYRADEEGEY